MNTDHTQYQRTRLESMAKSFGLDVSEAQHLPGMPPHPARHAGAADRALWTIVSIPMQFLHRPVQRLHPPLQALHPEPVSMNPAIE